MRTELVRTRLALAELARTELMRTKLALAELARTELTRTELVRMEVNGAIAAGSNCWELYCC